jgi:hypothetical protein
LANGKKGKGGNSPSSVGSILSKKKYRSVGSIISIEKICQVNSVLIPVQQKVVDLSGSLIRPGKYFPSGSWKDLILSDPEFFNSGFLVDKGALLNVIRCQLSIFNLVLYYGYDEPLTPSSPPECICSDWEKFLVSFQKSIQPALKIIELYGPDAWVKYYKYKLAAYDAHWSDPLGGMPKWPFRGKDVLGAGTIACGAVGRWLRLWMRRLEKRDGVRFHSFLQSVSVLKKDMPTVSESMIQANIEDTFRALTTPKGELPLPTAPVTVSNGTRQVMELFSHVDAENRLRATIDQIFVDKKLPTYAQLTKFTVPSLKANVDKKGVEGGFLVMFNGIIRSLHEEEPDLFSDLEIPPILASIQCSKPTRKRCGLAGIEEQFELDQDHDFYDLDFRVHDTTSVSVCWRRIWEKLFLLAKEEMPHVIFVGLPEPLKVRVISKGPPLTYYALQPFQKYLHGVLRQHPCCRFIGTPDSDFDINAMFAKAPRGAWFLSGDYRGATNEIRSWPAEILIDQLFVRLRTGTGKHFCPTSFLDDLEQLTLKAMTQHLLCYRQEGDRRCFEKLTREGSDSLLQREGQLMGSVVSFIFLCLINLTCCDWSMEINERRKTPLCERLLQVNGDDCALVDLSPDGGLFPIWEAVTGYFGLIKSEGKSFFSRDFVLLNSRRYFRFDGESFLSVPFLNFALIHAKSKDGMSNKQLWELGGLTDKLLKLCPLDMRERAVKEFLSTNYGKLKKLNFLWCLPKWCGGLGIALPSSFWESNEGVFVRKVARVILNHFVASVRCFPADAASLVWSEVSKFLGTRHNFSQVGTLSGRDVDQNCRDYFIQKVLFSGKNILNLSNAKDNTHYDGELRKKTSPEQQFVMKCWKVIHHHSLLHQRAVDKLLTMSGFVRPLTVEELGDDLPPVFRSDIIDTDFFRDAVLHNIDNQVTNYFL